MNATVSDRAPNCRSDGRCFPVRCFACDRLLGGRDTRAASVYAGVCGWTATPPDGHDHSDSPAV